ncbi:hypothetical protein ACNFU2_00605 [Chryseobacterium sp. PTM-20240506]|uniref:hypothetical protein n=1 Tax=unclassified Chryseobacterium TaxID=2593645 RepID=UPI00235967F8|nr:MULTISPECIES: hypothetical protein [unclassified Chryseobacterium]MDC8103386.1 hypothetical protein [Chryseobacterium sp. B21-037]MDQ1802942.1 hypothetical protein [Chryseobacterium sp. CKR4-1]
MIAKVCAPFGITSFRGNSNTEPFLISFKDGNRFHLHAENLEKLSVSKDHFRRTGANLVANSRDMYEKEGNLYSVEGELIATF